ncbi:fimbria/pilus periplasmic chaperone [Aeromonas salmonicida]|uniref:fimbria/pilus periplasmic chaperone n=1 Tax=Aeromonas salmonicida TaxID=645 RepID=UPI003CFDBF07
MNFPHRLLISSRALIIAMMAATFSSVSLAGGVALGATRIVYPADARQVTLPITNTDDKSRFLIKAWAEDSEGKKTSDFTVTPPLFMIGPSNEHILSLRLNAVSPLPSDRETLYWFNAQAIPQHDASKGENVLQLAALSKIKVFVRPAGLSIKPLEAPDHLRFSYQGESLVVHNPTPYHITLVSLMEGDAGLPNTMVPPNASLSLKASGKKGPITFRTINDYGAITDVVEGVMK